MPIIRIRVDSVKNIPCSQNCHQQYHLIKPEDTSFSATREQRSWGNDILVSLRKTPIFWVEVLLIKIHSSETSRGRNMCKSTSLTPWDGLFQVFVIKTSSILSWFMQSRLIKCIRVSPFSPSCDWSCPTGRFEELILENSTIWSGVDADWHRTYLDKPNLCQGRWFPK